MISDQTLQLVEQTVNLLKEKGIILSLAESCTGGLISALITAIPGSSAVLDRGFVVYSNQAKTDMLGVKESTLKKHGAVSLETAKEMAEGAINNSNAILSFSVTGIAGPGGGSVEKPVGMVCIGHQVKGEGSQSRSYHFSGNRHEVRIATLEQVFQSIQLICQD